MMNKILKNPLAKRKVAEIALCFLLAGGLVSCGECEGLFRKCLKIDHDLLRGTRWKLEYVHIAGSEDRKILEPQDCDTCYTLTFDAKEKYKITGVSILNTVSIQFQHFERPEMNILVTDLDEPQDGNLYTSLIRSVSNISGDARNTESTLTLFLVPSYNYLHYKRINP